MKQPPCDRDCFNCKFPDCIYDGLEYADYVEQAERDKALTETPQKRKLAAQRRAYREANKDKKERAYARESKGCPQGRRDDPAAGSGQAQDQPSLLPAD